MARLSVSVAAVFFLLTVALARTPSDLSENEVTVHDALPESVVKSILRLPSDTVNDESHSYPDSDVRASDIPESEPSSVRSVPFRVVRFHDFRPINRHFPLSLRSRFPFRPCSHHHHHHHPFFNRVSKHAEIPYGDDMMLSAGEVERDLDPLMRPFPETLPYHRHHHHHHDDEDGISKFVLKHSHRFGQEKFKKHLHHKHKDDDDEEEENEEKRVKEERKKREKGKKEEGGFVKRIRKFLDHF